MPSSSLARRLITIPAVVMVGVALVVLLPAWLPIATLADLVRRARRLPTVRLLAFASCWAWLEVAGVLVAAVLWLALQRRNRRLHYRLQRWWASRVLGALRLTCGVSLTVHGVDRLSPGPVLVFARHVSLADSIVTAVVVTDRARMDPRFVLKRELLADPCLDVVGNRIPNHFVDRGATDSTPELAALTTLAQGMSDRDAAIIFPEGTRAHPRKIAAALAKVADKDPRRAERLGGLRHLLPPRPSGAVAMAAGAAEADIVLGWHVGLEGLDRFGGIWRSLRRGPLRIDYHLDRVPRTQVGEDVAGWLDGAWLKMDDEVDAALRQREN